MQARLTARPIPKWHDVFVYLKDKQLPTVSPEQAQEMLDSGDWVLVDVRPAPEYEKAHPAAAISVPLYQGMVSQRRKCWVSVRSWGLVRKEQAAAHSLP